MTLFLTVLALAAPGADTPSVEAQTARCHTKACYRRVERKRARHRRSYMRRVIAPYRGWLARTQACESPTGRDSANGMYHGFYQFDVQSWYGAGGHGMPCQASWLEQSYRAVIWLKKAGRGAWPVCG